MPLIYLFLIKVLVIASTDSWAQGVTPALSDPPSHLLFLTKFREAHTGNTEIKCASPSTVDENINCPPDQNPALAAAQMAAKVAQESLLKLGAEKIKQKINEGLGAESLNLYGDDDTVQLKIVKSDGLEFCLEKVTQHKVQNMDSNLDGVRSFLRDTHPHKILSLMEEYITKGYLPPQARCVDEKSVDQFSPDECFQKILPHLKDVAGRDARDEAEKDCLQFFSPDAWYEKHLQKKMQIASKCHLSKDEIAAILFYTGNGYHLLNQALRAGGPTEWDNVISLLNIALKKLAPYDGYVRRGASLPQHVDRNYQQGSEITELAYTSTSVAKGFPGAHQFVIKAKGENCFYLGELSNSPREEEVLCLPGTRFEILHRSQAEGAEAKELCGEDQEQCFAIIMAEK